MRKIFQGLIFLLGWILSPFTWWNDTLVNIPLSYLLATGLHYLTNFAFRWLLILSYLFTNALGLFFMYFGGKRLLASSRNKIKSAAYLAIFLMIYSAIMFYLDKQGRLLPLGAFLQKYCLDK